MAGIWDSTWENGFSGWYGNMNGYSFDAHVHTSISRDACQSPENVVLSAVRNGLSAIAITDHNTFRGVSKAQQASASSNLIVIPGEEVSTEYGDLIGLFINEEIRSRSFAEVLDEIHRQGGLSVLPHPLRRKRMPPDNLLAKIDLVEILNGRTSLPMNEDAKKLAAHLKKPGIAGSDAHFFWEVGCVHNLSPDPFTNCDDVRRIIDTNRFIPSGVCEPALMRKANIGLSYAIKKMGNLTR